MRQWIPNWNQYYSNHVEKHGIQPDGGSPYWEFWFFIKWIETGKPLWYEHGLICWKNAGKKLTYYEDKIEEATK